MSGMTRELRISTKDKSASNVLVRLPVRKNSLGTSLKRTAFVPRLAYGCVGAGMGVIPLCAISSLSSACSSPSVAIDVAQHDAAFSDALSDAGADADASTPSLGPSDASDASSSADVPGDFSHTDAQSIGIRPPYP